MSDLVGELARDPAHDPDSVLEPLAPEQYIAKASWRRRLLDTVSTYLPLLLMTLLALGTWWLASRTPGAYDSPTARAPRHEPDYTMNRFTVQRFTAKGPMRDQMEGDTLRHYPDTDTIEIDKVRIHSISDDGHITNATANRALSNGDGSEIQLFGGAKVIREPLPGEESIEFEGEFLHAFLNTERVRSHLPVIVRQGRTEIHADSMEYDNLARVADFRGHVRATFPPAETRRAPSPTNRTKP